MFKKKKKKKKIGYGPSHQRPPLLSGQISEAQR